MKRILLAEDDFDFGAALKQYLELNKYEVVWGKDGEEALELSKKETFDIGIFDVMMPKLDGFSLAKKVINHNPDLPFLFLTARKAKEDRIKGLKLGADDYIAKPFEVEELILRLQNIIKRTEKKNSLTDDFFKLENVTIGKYIFDIQKLELRINGQTFKITEKEARLIHFLYESKNSLIQRDEILFKFWNNNDFFSGRSMDVFVSRIRKHFKEDESISIKSIRGIGLEFNIKS